LENEPRENCTDETNVKKYAALKSQPLKAKKEKHDRFKKYHYL